MIIISLLFFVLSLTVVVPAQNDEMWKATILSTECGHLFFLFGLLLLTALSLRFNDTRLPKLNAVFLAIGCVLFISPLATLSSYTQVSWKFADLVPTSPPEFSKKDYVYKKTADQELSLTLYGNKLLDRKLSSPVVITIHGGSWHGGTRDDLEEFNLKFLDLGYKVIAISYRLAPKHTYPAALEDSMDAINFVRDRASELGVDPNQIVLHGRSAGGHLAILAAEKLADASKKIKSVIAFYPITDFVWGYENSLPTHIVDGKFVLPEFTGKTLEQDRMLYEAASPLYQVNKNTPPILFIHGIRDELVSIHYSQALSAKLIALAIPHSLIQIPWATHAFDYFSFGPGSIVAFSEIKRFLRSGSTN